MVESQRSRRNYVVEMYVAMRVSQGAQEIWSHAAKRH